MAEYIEAKDLQDFRDSIMNEFLSLCNYNDYNKLTLLRIGETIDKMYDKYYLKPLADVVEVRHGEWETTDVTQEWDKVQRFGHFHNNPNCKFFYSDEDPNGHDYCPNCGAKMDGKEKNPWK